jgi:hypothetical protein
MGDLVRYRLCFRLFGRKPGPFNVAMTLSVAYRKKAANMSLLRSLVLPAYHFQTLRAMNDVTSDGAETAEVLETIKRIRSGDAQGWFRA